MSFSSNLKDELCRVLSSSRHCNIAEMTAIISLLGNVKISEKDEYSLSISTEHAGLARKCFTILKKTFNIGTDIKISRNTFLSKNHNYTISIKSDIEGSFLATGSMSDPEKAYHFEIVCATYEKANQIRDVLISFDVDAKIVERKKSFVVYIKDSEQIVFVLALIEANSSLLELENIRILKDVRNDVNRKVNCETANINKTVSAALKQIEDIEFIKSSYGLDILPEAVRDISILRLQYPEASLIELGTYLQPKVGKSGVNHRLRKLSEIADKLREERGI